MSEVLVRYTTATIAPDGTAYVPQACGRLAGDGRWEGWLEFLGADGAAVRTPRETEQPNRDALLYWAQGLTATYLDGALARATTPPPARTAAPSLASAFDGPATRPVLDPFATYAQGEDVLRAQLHALSHDHLVAIATAYGLDGAPAGTPGPSLAERIIAGVRDGRRG